MSDTKISEAASSEECLRAFNETLTPALRVPYIMAYRIAMDAALEVARQPGAPVPQGSEFVISRTLEDAEAASDGMLPAALVPVADEWYRLCERRFSVDRIRISGKLAEAIVNAVCAAPPAQGIDLGQMKRYALDDGFDRHRGVETDKGAHLYEHDDGDWVKWDDVEALIDQRDAAPGVG
jgi:hypothetical protein